MNIYVGNLARDVSDDDLRQAFGQFGTVTSAAVIRDKFTKESRGFGFVEMSSDEEGKAALQALNGQDIKGSKIRVSEARSEGGGGGGRPGGGRPGGGGGRPGGGRPGGGGGGRYGDRGGYSR